MRAGSFNSLFKQSKQNQKEKHKTKQSKTKQNPKKNTKQLEHQNLI
jgi:hypothetical protein